MHQAGTRFGGDVVAADQNGAFAIEQGVAIGGKLQGLTADLGFEGELSAEDLGHGIAQILRDDQVLERRPRGDLHHGVGQIPIYGHPQVGRNRPGRGCPDRHAQVSQVGL